ncbi:hypothetical protein GA0115255_1011115 [Streptomyces sp. Ncost-T6T-2b]|nr:hypothetical protein GA0115255_1011115 [Streptomyces sp. Ncost-T6T-2b]
MNAPVNAVCAAPSGAYASCSADARRCMPCAGCMESVGENGPASREARPEKQQSSTTTMDDALLAPTACLSAEKDSAWCSAIPGVSRSVLPAARYSSLPGPSRPCPMK